MNVEDTPGHLKGEFGQAELYRNLGQPAEAAEQAAAQPEADQAEVFDRVIQLEKEREAAYMLDPPQRFTEKYRINRAIRDEGAAGAQAIMSKMESGAIDPRDGLELAELCATTQNADQLGKILPTLDVFYSSAQETLARIGSVDSLVAMKAFLEAHPGDPDDSFSMASMDNASNLQYMIEVAIAIRERTKDQDDRATLDEAINEWVSRYNPQVSSLGKLTPDRLERMTAEQHPDLVALRQAEKFFWRGEDPDFGPSARAEEKTPDQAIAESPEERAAVAKGLHVLAEDRLVTHAAERSVPESALEIMAYREAHASPLAVTLGIEVEIERNTMVGSSDRREPRNQDERDEQLFQKAANYRRSEHIGVPARFEQAHWEKEIFYDWEFANQPTRHYGTLSREVQALQRLDLINADHEHHPLHLTIGKISTEGPAGNQAYVLARALEGSGWATTSGRVRQPLEVVGHNWAFKGNGGVKQREAKEVQLGMDEAVELRIFTLRSLSGFNRLARSAYALGSALSAYQAQAKARAEAAAEVGTRAGRANPDQAKLAIVWEEFSQTVDRLMEQHGMAKPSDGPWESHNTYDADQHVTGHTLDQNFTRFADLLEEAESGKDDTQGKEFQSKLQDAILVARQRIMPILEGTN